MSIGTFIAHLWNAIKSLFEKLPSPLKIAVNIGYEAVNGLKKITDFDSGDLIGSVFGQFGKSVEDKIRQLLPNVLKQLQLVKDCTDETDPDKILACALQTIQKIDPQFQAAYWHALSIYISQLAADGNLSWEDGVLILQWVHDHKKIEEA